ncbi:MAG: hypothetical protein LUH04_06295 [Clostridium sp.]|nr:hypothetical protein [Clostridium sp.]
MYKDITVSDLPKTWILDLDGTIVKHNGYKIDGTDTLLPGIDHLLSQISQSDMVIFLTSRSEEYKNNTLSFLEKHHIRYNHVIFNAPYGERILVNDNKPSGLRMAIAISTERDIGTNINFIKNPTI